MRCATNQNVSCKVPIKREKNDARICFSEREQTRPKVQAFGLFLHKGTKNCHSYNY